MSMTVNDARLTPAEGEAILGRYEETVLGPEGAPAFVFGHGYGSDQSIWAGVAERFADTHREVRID